MQVLVKNLGIRTQSQYHEWKRSDKSPNDIPFHPNRTYKKEWVNWGEFLGTGNVSKNKKKFKSYEVVRTLMGELNIRTQDQFNEWKRSGKSLNDIPFRPDRTYKKEWVSWGEFLGTGNINSGKKSYREGQRYVQDIGVTTVKELLEWLQSEERPEDFPPEPYKVWNRLWKGTHEFLKIEWLPFTEVQNYILSEHITTREEYHEFRKSDEILMNRLPPNPSVVYAPYWKSWDDFLLVAD